MIELRGIGKYFPSNKVTALRAADLTLRPGEVHALLGENGTGKSTLMHILAGYVPPSRGAIFVDGKERRFSSPAAALARGIGMVRQHPAFIRGFTVWEDCILGAETHGQRSPFLDPAASRGRVETLSAKWNFALPIDAKAETLTVSQRQKAAALALLLRGVKWFIFDEPTAVLTPDESKSLFELFARLAGEGRGIILITHKLDEALSVSDRITVMRSGVTDEPLDAKTLSVEELAARVSGDHLPGGSRVPPKNISPRAQDDDSRLSKNPVSAPVLVIKNLSLSLPGFPHIRNINLEVMPGTITGITGVRDGGLETLELAVTGLLRYLCDGSNGIDESGGAGKLRLRGSASVHAAGIEGSITLNGRDITGKGARAFRDAGGASLGADRLGNNLAPGLPIRESLLIHAFRRARRGFGIFLDMASLNSRCERIMENAGVARVITDPASSFSGGMLQRVLLAREFAERASLIVLAEPVSGLDKANRRKLEAKLKAEKMRGASVLLFSTDMEELVTVADEILLLKNGSLAAIDKRARGNNEK